MTEFVPSTLIYSTVLTKLKTGDHTEDTEIHLHFSHSRPIAEKKIQNNTVSLLIINDHVENKQNLTYAGLFSTHDQIWMMFRHLGFF